MPILHPEMLEPGIMYNVEYTAGWDGQEQEQSVQGIFIKTSIEYDSLLLHFRVKGSVENSLIGWKQITKIVRNAG